MFVFLMIMIILMPATMICFGILWKNHPPKDINWAYGYRTSMSMKSKETWEFAHKYCGEIWFWSGIITMFLSIIAMIFFKNDFENTSIWITIIQMLVLFFAMIPTEIALKKNFDKKGTRIN